jgi:hypothetical protein
MKEDAERGSAQASLKRPHAQCSAGNELKHPDHRHAADQPDVNHRIHAIQEAGE